MKYDNITTSYNGHNITVYSAGSDWSVIIDHKWVATLSQTACTMRDALDAARDYIRTGLDTFK